MWFALLAIFVIVGILVLISRYQEIPADKRPTFLNWLRRRTYRYPIDKNAKAFAEQWGKHPTLSQRKVNAIRRSLGKKK